MSMSRETVDTAYGRVDDTNLQKVRGCYDTHTLLSAVDELDGLVSDARSEDGLRDRLLSLHAMAHTVVNGASMVVPGGNASLPESAAEVLMQLHDTVSILQKWIRWIEPLKDLRPD